jgi:hypothetical protein
VNPDPRNRRTASATAWYGVGEAETKSARSRAALLSRGLTCGILAP